MYTFSAYYTSYIYRLSVTNYERDKIFQLILAALNVIKTCDARHVLSDF